MKSKVLSTLSVASLALAFSACGGAANTNTATNKPANAANTTVNSTSNAANTAANTTNTAVSNANSAAPTTGDVVKIDEAGVMMTVPKGFKYSKDGEDIIVKTEDEGVDIRFTVPTDGDYQKALTDAASEIDDYLKDVKIVDKGSKVDVAGMEGTQLEGTATNEGEPVIWNLMVLKAPKKPVLINFYGEKASMEKHQAQIETFLNSIKKQ